MANHETYEQHEARAFESTFPMEELTKIQEKANRHLDPFKTLSRFGFHVKDEKQAQDIVLAEISASSFGPQINMIDTESGVRIYGKDIVPFLKGALTIYGKTFSLWTDKARQDFSDSLSSK